MSDKHPNEDVPIVVLKNTSGKACSAADRRTIQQLVKQKLLLTSMEPYNKAQVEVQLAKDGSPKALVVTLLRGATPTQAEQDTRANRPGPTRDHRRGPS